ncbi:glycoside hydrolase family 128 protein [Ceratobasidium sp. AG-Ba]|nr:glycoside hydrolase family 128 protein [Ceratobasidium sp. AG-Ba]QRW02123.1 glycoside hydrolase family 128 protein [Ceratobasidium sp. AG-Ba]
MHSATYFITIVLSFFAAAPSVLAGKRGLAWSWANGSNLDPGKLASDQVTWMYNWETWRPTTTGGLNFIGTQSVLDSSSSPVAQLKTRAAQQGWNTVFSLNEPDLNGISPTTAANWYIKWINPLNITAATPAVSSNQNTGQGLDWTANFISACNGKCKFDYINLHWYGSTFAQFQTYVQNAHNRFPNNKLVISEFGLPSPTTQDQKLAFLKSAMSFLDSAKYVDLESYVSLNYSLHY